MQKDQLGCCCLISGDSLSQESRVGMMGTASVPEELGSGVERLADRLVMGSEEEGESGTPGFQLSDIH